MRRQLTVHNIATGRAAERQRSATGLRGRVGGVAAFTLIELMAVLSIIAILATIAVPMYQNSVTRAREAALMEDLYGMRVALDQYYADKGEYPQALGDLVRDKYIRKVPVDPFTRSRDTWLVDYADDGGIFDVRSGSDEQGRSGVPYSSY